MNDENKYELISKFLDGAANDSEKKELLKWCSASKENEQLFLELKEIWQISGKVNADFNPNSSIAWENIKQKITTQEKNNYQNNRNFSWYFSRAAAVFLIGFALYFVFILKSTEFEKVLSKNEVKEVLLPDGSKVWLNKFTELKYVKEFEGKTRLVKLNGEAYFEVSKNPDKPFIIESEFSRVKVLGTSFNYRAYLDDKENVLFVNTGRVEFSDNEQKQKVILIKGEKAKLDVKENIILRNNSKDQNYLAWKTGVFHFENETFEKIIKCLGNVYKQKFEFEDSEIKSVKLTVSFNNKKLDDILKILEHTISVRFQKSSEKIIIK